MTSANPTGWTRIKRALSIREAHPLDTGLRRINDRIGLHGRRATIRKAAKIRIEKTESRARSIFFAPDMDGQADSGEVVWVWTPSTPPQERAVLVVGRTRATILGLLISPNPDHSTDDSWLAIGSGEWDEQGRQCWIRLDRVLEIAEEQVRRQGALFPERRFERIANRLRSRYHWG
ncbi:type II toxin-antitoxin system PemK/MazF family toxin [Corynebacterium phoceense]|uniref:type II toxin-antitoxin system PemK/MazF family toxin n=1 Tax=Corynebacterium phoceense TaxID=1686286 RepID=UPI001D97F38B|nr:type II toxin-antitoxin system PemK/MazF family toxin [Corynebacterium phoceense]MCQ9334086.1 type II toxin-antitoxin system PemK/MazF family toxin [Corynebacterium phoceense]MCQ9337337.1 type II toxin-antitoxin system PemK/MazF family toxin [Corynebacterium phoceense]HJG44621.1 type II toxin-antitoxin system PemK/MazF family toxin [Corynebacterium phoceense]